MNIVAGTNYGSVFHIHRVRVVPRDGGRPFSSIADEYTFNLAEFRAAMLAKFSAGKMHLTYTQIPQNAIEDPQTN